jgi:poly [ADP-ribose] polymerase 2/3/4
MMFYGPLEKCPVCEGQLEFKEWKYKCTGNCTGNYTEWARCTFRTDDPSRISGPIEVPDDIKDDFIRKVMRLQFVCASNEHRIEHGLVIKCSCTICIYSIGLQWMKQQEGKGKEFPKRDVDEEAHILSNMMIDLSGQMTRLYVIPLNNLICYS